MANWGDRAFEWRIVSIDDATLTPSDGAANITPLERAFGGSNEFALTNVTLPTFEFNEITENNGRGYEIAIQRNLEVQEASFGVSEFINALWLQTGAVADDDALTNIAMHFVMSREEDTAGKVFRVELGGRVRSSAFDAFPTDGNSIQNSHVFRPVKTARYMVSRYVQAAETAALEELATPTLAESAVSNSVWREVRRFNSATRTLIVNGVDQWRARNAALGIA